MQELIPLNQDNREFPVSGRDLHSFLEIKTEFAKWIQRRIKEYDFVQGQDYTSFVKIVEREIGATTQIEYTLSLDMAKELAMVEGNEKGKQARQYFITCEKALREIIKPRELSRKELALLVIESEEEKERLQIELKKTEAVLNSLHHVSKTYTATEIAKELGFRSAIELNQDLHRMGIQFKQGETWVLYSKYSERGYTEIKQEVLDSGRIVYHRKFTQSGREFLIALFSNRQAS